jgi:glutaredoxin
MITRSPNVTTTGDGPATHVITLYAKAGCHLCDETREYLEELVARHGDQRVELAEVDIRRDEALFERYRFRIPVIAVNGVERLEGRIQPEDVARLLDLPPDVP